MKKLLKIVWGVTGAGDLISEVFNVMRELAKMEEMEVTALLSKAGLKVVKWYKLMDDLTSKIAKKVIIEEDANTPFIVGPLQTGKYNYFLVAPASANTVAKIANGIADTIITNAVSQANKANIPIYILPVDQKTGTITTTLTSGKKLELTMRDVDLENTNKLRKMKGITVLKNPEEIKNIANEYRKA